MKGIIMNKTDNIKRSARIRYIAVTAILAAAAGVIQLLEFPLPFLIPPFIKMDFSELPALMGSFALGPVCGILVCFLKNVIKAFTTSTGFIGEFCNFLLGAAFVATAGLIYKFRKTRKGAIVASLVGSLVMALVSLPVNYFISYPVYIKLFMPLEVILGMYQAILPSVKTLWGALIIFNLPFTFAKGLIDSVITFLIYKKISPLLKTGFTRKDSK
jgi:riboflavin transporter FmnP